MWMPELEPGSARPGRGGRRKRMRRQQAQRLLATMHARFPTTCWTLIQNARPRLAFQPLGRRERRRRAKLRRRRARVEREGRRFVPWVLCRPSPLTAQLYAEVRQWAEEQAERILIGSSA